MKKFVQWLKDLLLCQHDWVLIDTVQEQNLRTGHVHWSNIYHCRICGKHETRDIDL